MSHTTSWPRMRGVLALAAGLVALAGCGDIIVTDAVDTGEAEGDAASDAASDAAADGAGQKVSFARDIRTLLQLPSASGGAGCFACHVEGVDAGSAPGGLYMGGSGSDLYRELTAEAPTDDGGTGQPFRIDRTGDAAASLLLTNPLFGDDEPHPVKVFADVTDPRYVLIRRWIEEGAVDDSEDPVDFDTQVRPLLQEPTAGGGAGCDACHGDPEDAGGGLYMGGGAAALYAALTAEAPSDDGGTGEPFRVNLEGFPDRSLLLTNPLATSDEPHPVKLFASTDDARYQLIRQWIAEGAKREGGPTGPVSFATDVAPLLQSQIGCTACHSTCGSGDLDLSVPSLAALWLYLRKAPATDGSVDGQLTRVDTAQPERSLLLTNPLATSAEPHPVKVFATVNDARYQLLQAWIAEGAGFDAGPEPISFAYELVPLLAGPSAEGGLGCGSCHGSGAGGFTVSTDPDAMWFELFKDEATDGSGTGETRRVNVNEPAKSLLLTNPLATSAEAHPTKPFANVNDPDYQLLLRFISNEPFSDATTSCP